MTRGLLGRAAALAGALVLSSAAATPAASLRHVDYHLAFGIDGTPSSGTVRLDFVASRGEGAVTVDVADDDAVPVRAQIDRSGGIQTVLDQALSDTDLTLLAAVALESENLNGVEAGDQWSRTTPIPGGRMSVRYKVLRNDDRGHVSLSVARTVQSADGEESTWRGSVDYDANAFVPTSIAMTGRARSLDDADAHAHTLSVSLKLVNDTFAHNPDD